MVGTYKDLLIKTYLKKPIIKRRDATKESGLNPLRYGYGRIDPLGKNGGWEACEST